MRAARRALTLAALVTPLLLLAVPGTAQAHTRTQETTNIDSRITAGPGIPGVTWTVHTGGLLVEVENRTDAVLVVEGYDGEPYLRIGPDGVEQNRRSPATYLNDERFGDVAVPPAADPTAPPEWVRVSDQPRALWHDHRTHWMSPQPPPFVEAGRVARAAMRAELVGPIGRAGGQAGPFHPWRIPITHDGTPAALEGELAWEDPPPAWPWLALAALLVAPGLLGVRRTDVPGIVRPAALVVGAVAAVNAIHLVDDLVAWPSHPLDELFGILHTSLFLGVGLGGAIWALRVDSGRVLALGIASAGVLYHQGLVHLPLLAASQFPTVWPQGLVRATVALGLAQAAVVGAVVVAALRRGELGPSSSVADETLPTSPVAANG